MKINTFLKNFPAPVLFFAFFSLLPQAAFSQDFSSIDSDLSLLENLLNNTLANMEEQQTLLNDLRANLTESGNIIANYESIIQGQENLLRALQIQLNAMSEIFRTQSDLSLKFEKSSRFWKTFTLVGIPAAVLLSGIVVYVIVR